MKFLTFILLSIIWAPLLAQHNLLSVGIWSEKVQDALGMVKQYEPHIFSTIVTKSTIQAGDLEQAGLAAFCSIEEAPTEKLNWIIIGMNELNKSSCREIASIIVHESLHLQFRMLNTQMGNWGTLTKLEKFNEHKQIYNYELAFLKKSNGTKDEILSHKNLMRQYGIPIF